jgi:FKBP-type peptidyl-prolyl cis-trans isomerase FklB
MILIMNTIFNRKNSGWRRVSYLLLLSFLLLSYTACTKEVEEESDFDNWEEQNDAFISKWSSDSGLLKFKTYTKNQTSTGSSSDYVYVKVVESGSGTESPLFNDTIRVAYRMRYIPTKTYIDGYLVGDTYTGDFNWKTIGVADFALTGTLINGFSTAVLNMHVGDRWIVHIPYPLAYGNPSSHDGILDASNLIYDLALVDFWHPDETVPPFKVRMKSEW